MTVAPASLKRSLPPSPSLQQKQEQNAGGDDDEVVPQSTFLFRLWKNVFAHSVAGEEEGGGECCVFVSPILLLLLRVVLPSSIFPLHTLIAMAYKWAAPLCQ